LKRSNRQNGVRRTSRSTTGYVRPSLVTLWMPNFGFS
jgi:hypothetical protein